MQRHKGRFCQPDGGRHGSLQSCVRTNDIEFVGDGSHLTYFEMVGNFEFGGNDYEASVELWHSILTDLRIPVSQIHVHPSRTDHRKMWENRGYQIVTDSSCQWSDGEICGNCCEVFCGDLEIGNLVNPEGRSTDVGFGWERIHQVVEQKNRIDETSLFPTRGHPIILDHSRTIAVMRENGIEPGNKGRNYVCRKLIRRMLPLLTGEEKFEFDDWIRQELELRERNLLQGRRYWRKNRNKPVRFWWETFGILPEETKLLES